MNAVLPVASAASAPRPAPPLGMLAELTHRCPLQCPYCANPLEMERASAELDTASWKRVLEQAAALGVLQVHFSGGEPTVRRDLVALVVMIAVFVAIGLVRLPLPAVLLVAIPLSLAITIVARRRAAA